VNSGAAVQLTTKAFAALKADAGIGRAEALRRSISQLILHRAAEDAHPAIWGPSYGKTFRAGWHKRVHDSG